jgi:hypothetical protein
MIPSMLAETGPSSAALPGSERKERPSSWIPQPKYRAMRTTQDLRQPQLDEKKDSEFARMRLGMSAPKYSRRRRQLAEMTAIQGYLP